MKFKSINPFSMASNKKIVIRIILGLFLLCTIGGLGFIFIVYKAIDYTVEDAKRIEGLPEIEGVLCSENHLVAPVSGDSVAFYLVVCNVTHRLSSINTKNSYSHDVLLPDSYNVCIKTPAKEFIVQNESKALVQYRNMNVSTTWEATSRFLSSTPEIPAHLIGFNSQLDCMVASAFKKNWNIDLGIDLSCTLTDYTDIELTEYTWKKGDELIVKGEVKNGEAILLW